MMTPLKFGLKRYEERKITLRALFGFLILSVALSASSSAQENTSPVIKPRMRVIIDNDFGGDPDGLFQLAHHMLCPSVDVRGVIGSHHYPQGFYGYSGSAKHACTKATELLTLMGKQSTTRVFEGATESLKKQNQAQDSEASRFIIAEAMRTDASTPLYVVCGAGLTNIASALLAEPKIANRLILIWIGGAEYPGHGVAPPGKPRMEYNLGIDLMAAQAVFSHSNVPIWQIPRNAYRQVLVSYATLAQHLDAGGETSAHLIKRLRDLMIRAKGTLGESYVLGDSPLVLLTALQTSWEPDPASSDYVELPAPTIDADGNYQAMPNSRKIRVYQKIDTRLLMDDFFSKIASLK